MAKRKPNPEALRAVKVTVAEVAIPEYDDDTGAPIVHVAPDWDTWTERMELTAGAELDEEIEAFITHREVVVVYGDRSLGQVVYVHERPLEEWALHAEDRPMHGELFYDAADLEAIMGYEAAHGSARSVAGKVLAYHRKMGGDNVSNPRGISYADNPKGKKPAKRKRRATRPAVPIALPPKKKNESWVAYHDRLTELAREAEAAGDTQTSTLIYSRAGQIAALRKRVRDQPRKAKRRGPGSYPWKECIRQTEARMKRRFPTDYKQRARAVCGSIRAASQRRYPAYWKARDPGRALPGPKTNPRADELATDRSDAWLDHKGMQYVAAVEVQEQIVAIVREPPGAKGNVLDGDVLISRGYESPTEALDAGKAKIDEIAGMKRGKVA